jgi:hypothetical protein
MRNRLFALITLLWFLFSCSENEFEKQDSISSLRVENDRLAFSSTEELQKTLTELNSKSNSEVKQWIKSYNFESFLNKTASGEELEDFSTSDLTKAPLGIQAILNAEGEVKVGETIVWYNNGLKHFIPNNNENLLSKIKLDPSLDKNPGWYSIKPYNGSKENVGEGRIYISGLDARHQREFTYINGTPRKFVHEIYVYSEVGYYWQNGQGYQSISYVLLNVKLEFKNSKGKWRVAGEPRNISINLAMASPQYYSSGSLVNPTTYPSTAVNLTFNNSQDRYDIVLASGSGPTYYGYSPAWNIDVSGTIYQYIVNDLTSNAWNNTGNPLW